MDPACSVQSTVCHVVAMPYPGRGHINPMMNLCKLIASKAPHIRITFVVTEEWLGFIGADAKPTNLRFASITNVIPSELVRGAEFSRFYEAVMTKMEVPFEHLLNQLEPPVTNILADAELFWPIRIGNSRNIPVASLFTTSATFFSMLHCFDHLQDLHFLVDSLENGDGLEDNFPGSYSTQIADLGKILHGCGKRVTQLTLESISWVPKTQYLLFNSVYELEAKVYDTLKDKFPFPIYPIGPAIPFFEFNDSSITNDSNYLEWLDLQPAGSVLYVSLGSFLSISADQMDEIEAGMQISGVRYLWVARGETSRMKKCGSEMGMGLLVPWCNQLKVLCHSSIGGFWTHCGWNSTLEALFAGIPMLSFPINYDQIPNSEKIVKDWKIGWKVTERVEDEKFVNREEIAELVQKFMDQSNIDVQNMRKKARALREICHQAVAKGGSSESNLDAFINDIMKGQYS